MDGYRIDMVGFADSESFEKRVRKALTLQQIPAFFWRHSRPLRGTSQVDAIFFDSRV
jgi:hypothetical protein